MIRHLIDCEVTLTGSDHGNRVTVNGLVKDVSLNIERNWEDPERSLYSFKLSEFSEPNKYTLTFTPRADDSHLVVRLSGVERSAKVAVDSLSATSIEKARTRAKVSSDTEFEVVYEPGPNNDKAQRFLVFKWWEY